MNATTQLNPPPSHWVHQDRLAGGLAAIGLLEASGGADFRRHAAAWRHRLARPDKNHDVALLLADTAWSALPDQVWARLTVRFPGTPPPPTPDAAVRACLHARHRDIEDWSLPVYAGLYAGLFGFRHPESLRSLLPRTVHTLPRPRADRTSHSDPIRLDAIPLPSVQGALAMTLCPGKNQPAAASGSWRRDLAVDLDRFVAWGATDVVSLITFLELRQLRVEGLGQAVADRRMTWHHHPVQDGHAPDAAWMDAWHLWAPPLIERMRRGARIVIHCKGGLGRAGTVAALMVSRVRPEASAAEVVTLIRTARPNAIETVAQERFLRQALRQAARMAG